MSITKATGEPYDLAGKRLVFTSWFHVRPAWFQWYDKDGKAFGLITSEAAGPWDAEFRSTDCPWGIRIAAQQAERVGPLLETERPWEAKGVGLSNIIHDEGTYRAWGICMNAENEQWPCYFESKDGMNWERPDLGLIEYDGSRKNNLIGPGVRRDQFLGLQGRVKFFGWSVFKDPSAPAEERYKALRNGELVREEFEDYLKRRPDDWEPVADRVGKIVTISGAVSPDGINWKWLPDPLVVEHADGQMIAHYDERLGKYVMYTRNRMVGFRSEQTPEYGGLMSVAIAARRAIGRAMTDDFRRFPVSETIITPGPDMPPSDTFYTNCWTTIPGAPDHQLMFPTVYHQTDDTTSIALAAYHDGDVWHFVPGSPVLRTSAFGEWDGGCIFAHPNLLELPNGDFALPYAGYTFPHKYPRGEFKFLPGYAIWPKGRLVALEAPERGEFATAGIMPPGRRARINALTQRAGGILIEVTGLDGKPIEGRTFANANPIIGDQHWTPVTWKSGDDLGHKDGAPILLRFRLDKAKIFGLEFE